MEYTEIKIQDIKVIENICQKESKVDLAELMDSIKQNGLLQAIGVKKNNGDYTLIWGYRRLKACEKLGWRTIPVRLFLEDEDEISEEDFLILNATENIQRKTINLMEIGRICSYLMKKGLTQSEVATRLSMPKNRVRMAIDEWYRVPTKYKEKIKVMDNKDIKNKKGNIGVNVASSIVRLRNVNQEERNLIFDWAIANEKTTEEIYTLKQLLSVGFNVKKAIAEMENWKPLNCKIVANKFIYDKVFASNDFKNNQQLVTDSLNKLYPGLIFEKN